MIGKPLDQSIVEKGIINRWQTERVKRRLSDRRVMLLAGARQCGKTTLARALRSDDTEYLTLDDQTLRAAAVDDPKSFVRHSAKPLIINEIQRVPELLPAIKLVVDEDRRPGQFLLTGSANLAAIPQAKESLAGRVANIRLRPFTQGELSGIKPSFLANAFSAEFPRNPPKTCRDEVIVKAFAGGYPEALELEERARRAWHRDYVTALLELDLRQYLENLRDGGDLGAFGVGRAARQHQPRLMGVGLHKMHRARTLGVPFGAAQHLPSMATTPKMRSL